MSRPNEFKSNVNRRTRLFRLKQQFDLLEDRSSRDIAKISNDPRKLTKKKQNDKQTKKQTSINLII